LNPANLNKIAIPWFGYLVLLTGVSLLPHWPATFLTWFNYSLYFLLFLVSFFLYLKERYLKDLFLLLTITYFAFSVSLITNFIGVDYLFGSNRLAYQAFVYKKVLLDSLLTYSVLNICGRYIFRDRNRVLIYSALVVLAINLLFTRPFFEFSFLQREGISQFFFHLLPFDVINLLAFLVYGYVYLTTRRPNGFYIHQYIILLSICNILNILDYFKGVEAYGYDQYFLVLTLLLMIRVLHKRYLALNSDRNALWEKLIFDNAYLTDLKVTSHSTGNDRYPSIVDKFPWNWPLKIHAILGVVLLSLAFLFRSVFVTTKLIVMVVWLGVLVCLLNVTFRNIRERGISLNINVLEKK
jgi:hypothetical protein